MDKWIREKSKRANGMLTCGNEDIPPEPSWTKSVGWDREKRETRKKKEGGRRRSKERSSTLSLDFSAIGPSIRVRARGKVLPCGKSFKQG